MKKFDSLFIYYLKVFPSGNIVGLNYQYITIYDKNFNILQEINNENSGVDFLIIEDENNFVTNYGNSIKRWSKYDNKFNESDEYCFENPVNQSFFSSKQNFYFLKNLYKFII